jgi:hypothetical protein
MEHLRDGSVTKTIQIVEERRARASCRQACGPGDTWLATLPSAVVGRRLGGEDGRDSRCRDPKLLEALQG